jgi:hypothetical protein
MTRPKHLWLLISVQSICIGLGLWLQQRYLLAELRSTLRNGTPAAQGVAADGLEARACTLPGAWGIGIVTFLWSAGLAGAATYLLLSRMTEERLRRRVMPERDALRRSMDLLRTRDAVIFGLAKLADSRATSSRRHS